MKSIFKIFGFSRRSPGLQSSSMSEEGNRHWHEDFIFGAFDTDALWYYERRRWRGQG